MTETTDLIQQLRNLHIQECAIHTEQEHIISRLEELATNGTKKNSKPILKVGDRVRIKNRITASGIFTKTIPGGDRNATVTKVKKNRKGQVEKAYILTDNGLATYRLPKNLEQVHNEH